MKKTIIYGFIMALCAVAFASCTTDETLDSVKVALSGRTKTITVIPAIDQTRTTLTADHKLLWAEGDTFGILAAQGTTILKNIESDPYDPSKENDEYEIEVPEETTVLYCYYPYDAENDALEQENISEFTFTLPDYLWSTTAGDNYEGEFLPQYHFMVSQSEISNNENLVFAKFTPAVTVVEFNIYDTDRDADTIQGLVFTGDDYITGDFTPDFASGELTHTGDEGNYYVTLLIAEDNRPSVGKAKEDGAKLYITVPAAEYGKASVQVVTTNHDYSSGYFDELEWEDGIDLASAYGKTVNLNLVHAKPKPLAEPLGFSQVDGNPFFATIPVKVMPECDFFAIAVFETSTYNTQKNVRGTDPEAANYGKNSFDTAVDELYEAFTAYFYEGDESKLNSKYQYGITQFYPFEGYFDENTDNAPNGQPRTLTITEDWQLRYNGYWNSETHAFDKPGRANNNVLQPNKSYTFVAYAKSAAVNKYPEDIYVYETEFTTPAMEFNGTGTITIGEYTQTGGTATAKITASGIKKIVWWIAKPNELQPKNGELTATNLLDALNDRASQDCYFRDYTEEITLTQTGMDPGQKYYFCAAGVDEDGKLVAGNVLEASAADVEFNSDKYTLTDVKLASQPTAFCSSELTFTFANGQAPAYLRIYSVSASIVDGEAEKKNSQGQTEFDERPTLSWEYLQNNLRSTSKTADYVAVKVEGNEVTYKVNLPGDDKGSVDSSGSEDVEIPSEGNNPFYILVVGADNEGDLATELGAIYQITGQYDEPKFTKLTDDIIRGVAEGDKTHTVTNTNAYYYSCPSSEFGEAEEEDKKTDIWNWGNYTSTPGMMRTPATSILYLYDANGATKLWLIKLGEVDSPDELEYPTYGIETRAKYTKILGELFENYEAEQAPSSSANVLKTITDIGTSYSDTKAQFVWTEPANSWAADWQGGEVYALVGLYGENQLAATIKFINYSNGLGSIGNVDSGYNPKTLAEN